MQILVRKSPIELLQGIGLDRNQVKRITLTIGNAVKGSFDERHEKMSDLEVKERTDFCFKKVLHFICDYEFAVKEVEKYLATALRFNLLGMEYQPSARLLDGHKPETE